MNREMVKEIKFNIDSSNICTNDELNKSIIVTVDKGLLEKEKTITNELVEIGYNELYTMLTSKLIDAAKYIKKVNLKKPFKQNVIGKFMQIELDVDYLSSTTWLYTCLTDMIHMLPCFEALFDRINAVEKEFSDMISNNSFSDITVFNKTSLLAKMEGLKQMKLSLMTIYNCYCYVLKNPQVQDFFIQWLYYKQALLCQINSEYVHRATEYNRIMISRIKKL